MVLVPWIFSMDLTASPCSLNLMKAQPEQNIILHITSHTIKNPKKMQIEFLIDFFSKVKKSYYLKSNTFVEPKKQLETISKTLTLFHT